MKVALMKNKGFRDYGKHIKLAVLGLTLEMHHARGTFENNTDLC